MQSTQMVPPGGNGPSSEQRRTGDLPFSPLMLRPSRSSSRRGVPPTIVEPLKAREITAGEELHIQCLVTADPPVEFQWTKNSIPISQSVRVQYGRSEQGHLFLTIAKTKQEDSGVYMVIAKNPLGMAKISCQILVVASEHRGADERSRKAVFLKVPSDQTIQLNSTAILEFELRVFLDTKIIWLLNGQPLKATTRIENQFDGRIARLIIRNFCIDDCGVYTVLAVNADGESSADVFLSTTGSTITRESAQSLKKSLKRTSSAGGSAVYLERSLRPVHGKIVRLEESAPIFVKTIRNISAKLGSNALFSAQCRGYPAPKISWYLHGQMLQESNRVVIEFDESTGNCTLCIKGITNSDLGMYTLNASNDLGHVSCSARLIQATADEDISLSGIEVLPILSNASVPSEPSMVKSEVQTTGFVDPRAFQHLEMGIKASVPVVDDQIDRDKPLLLKPIEDCSVEEGENIVLVAKIFSETIPQLIWLKNEGPIIPSSRFLMTYEKLTGKAQLTISAATTADAGVYALVVRNQKGFITCHCNVNVLATPNVDLTAFVSPDRFAPLEVDKRVEEDIVAGVEEGSCAPNIPELIGLQKQTNEVMSMVHTLAQPQAKLSFKQQLSDVTVSEGDNVMLQAVLSAQPPPSMCTWYHNGTEISVGSRYDVHFHSFKQIAALNLKAATNADSGQYKLVVANPAGTITSVANVTVNKIAGVDSSTTRSEQAYSTLERVPEKVEFTAGVDSKSYARNLGALQKVDEEKKPAEPEVVEEKLMAPTLLSQLSNSHCAEGESILMTVKVDAIPIPQIEWTRNGVLLTASNRIIIHYDILLKLVSLLIKQVTVNDAGQYEMVASNKVGKISCKADLTVDAVSSIERTPFVRTDKFTELERDKRVPLSVQPGVDTSFFVEPSKFAGLDEKVIRAPEIADDTSRYEAPVMIASLQEKSTFPEGSLVQLIAVVSGYPVPEFVWMKDGKALQPSNRVQQDYNLASKLCCLTINFARDYDSGVYTLVAKNAVGEKTSQTVMSIQPMATIDSKPMLPPSTFEAIEHKVKPVVQVVPGVDSSSMFNQQLFAALEREREAHVVQVHEVDKSAPVLVRPLSNVVATQGEDVCMMAQLFGIPMPEVSWFKNNQPIAASSRVVVYYDILNKTAYLWLKKSIPEDSAQYGVVAKNQEGTVTSKCQVVVNPSGKDIDDSFYVSPEHFQSLEKPEEDKYSSLVSGVDQTGFVDKTKLDELEVPRVQPRQEPEQLITPLVFTSKLSDISCKELESIVLEACVDGAPIDKFVWTLNDVPISASNNVRPEFNSYSRAIRLRILSANAKFHQGRYRLTISNQRGSVSSDCLVTIEQIGKIDSHTERELKKYQGLEVQIVPRDYGPSGIDRQPYTHSLDKIMMLDAERQKEVLEERVELKKPEFLGPISISQKSLSELDNVTLSVRVEGSPTPKLYWMKDGQPLPFSNRFAMHYDLRNRTLSFYIQGVRLSDAGTYYAVAQNQAGSTISANITIDVQPISSIDSSSKKPIELYSRLDESKIVEKAVVPGVDRSRIMGDEEKIALLEAEKLVRPEVVPGVDQTGFVALSRFSELEKAKILERIAIDDTANYRKPELLSNLTGTEVLEGQSALISLMTTGWPLPDVKWFKDGAPLPMSNRISSNYDAFTKVLGLLIKQAELGDAGEYSVTITNALGTVQDKTAVKVLKDDRIDQKSFIPNSEQVLSKLDQEKLVPREYTAGIDKESYVDVNKIKKMEESRQPAPRVYTAGIDQTAMICEQRFVGLEKPLEHKEFEEDRSLFRAPMIMQPMQDTSVTEDQELFLSCVVDGIPPPSFELLKDGNPIKPSNRHVSFYDMNTKVLHLRVGHVRFSDSGVYTVVAKNECGTSENSAKVVINRTPSIDLSSAQPDVVPKLQALDQAKLKPIPEPEEVPAQAPQFVEASRELNVPEGASISVPIQLNPCYPMPTFKWTKDGRAVEESNRFLHHYDMCSKILLFKIVFAKITDAGNFVVEAINSAGKAQFTLKLKVERSASIDRSWQGEKTASAVQQLEEKLVRPMPVTLIASTVDSSSFVQEPGKFVDLDAQKPRPVPAVVERKANLAPQFLKQLENVTVDETKEVLLSAQLNFAYPICTIQWFRNKMELRTSNRVQPTYDLHTGTVSLRLLACQMRDSGQYTVSAKNSIGQQSTSCLLTVNPVASIDESLILPPARLDGLEKEIKRPELLESETATGPLVADSTLQSIKNVELEMERRSAPVIAVKEADVIPIQILKQPEAEIKCMEGSTVFIQCVVSGHPMPQFIWYKNGKQLYEANRYSCHYDLLSKTVILRISFVSPELDAGTYVLHCIGTGNQKLTSQDCNLSITALPGIYKDKLVSSDKGLKDLDELSRQIEERKIQSYAKLEAGVDRRPFVDTEKFARLEKQEQVLVPITAGVDSTGFVPIDRFTGLEQPLPVKEFTAGIDQTPSVAESSLNYMQAFDQYRFSEVHEPLARESRLKMVQPIKKEGDFVVIEGLPASISCTIDAYPMPEIKWSHNGRLIESSQRIITSYDAFSGTVYLHFMVVYARDAGKYNVSISNSVGELKDQVELRVESTANIDESSYIRSTSSYELKSGNLEVIAKGKQMDFSEFPSETLHGAIGANLIIRYKPIGGANTEVHWMLNDVEITERLKINVEEDGSCWFQLNDLSKEQCGMYSCSVKNAFGEFTRTFTVACDSAIAGGKGQTISAPVIVEELKSMVVREGDAAQLSVQFLGSPPFEISWLMDDLPVKEDDRKSIKISNEQIASMSISKARKSDAGWYQCTIKNSAGTAVSKAKLLVMAADQPKLQVPFSPLSLRAVQQGTEEDARARWIKPPVTTESVNPMEMFLGQLRRSRTVKGTEPSSEKMTLSAEDMYSEKAPKPAQLKIRLPETMEILPDHDYMLQTTVVPIDDPNMKVQWMKDGKTIESGDRLSCLYEMGYASLTIKKAQSSDAGKYECVATNKQGSDRTACLVTCQYSRQIHSDANISESAMQKLQMLETQQSFASTPVLDDQQKTEEKRPAVSVPLNDTTCKEGQQIRLSAKFTSNPKARVSWTLNGKVLVSAGRFSITDDGMLNTLTINSSRAIDSGEVRCVAKNRLGDACTSCKLIVSPAERPAYWDLVLESAMEINLSADEISKMEEEIEQRLETHRASGQAKTEAEALVKNLVQDLKAKYKELAQKRAKQAITAPVKESPSPYFISQPSPAEVKQGEPIALAVRFAPPNCTVTWMRNHATLQNSKDISIRTGSDGRSCLFIPYALPTDSGTYDVKISNTLGSSMSGATVQVSAVQGQKSDIIVVPNSRKVAPGANARFTCQSRQKVDWTRLTGATPPANRFQSRQLSQDSYQLTILKVTPADAGKYACKIAGRPDSEAVVFELLVDEGAASTKQSNVIVPLNSSMDCKEGSNVLLECQIETSSDNDKCLWMKNNQQISTPYAEAKSIGDLHTLRLFNVGSEDQGTYSAVMQASGLRTECKLTVSKRPANEEKLLEPIIASAIKSTSVMQGQSAKFEFRLKDASTTPEINWTKDNRPLPQSQDYEIWYKNGNGMLLVKKTLLEDSGVYGCTIKQSGRSASCNALLSVRRGL